MLHGGSGRGDVGSRENQSSRRISSRVSWQLQPEPRLCEAGVVGAQGHVTHVLGSGQSIHRDCSRDLMQNNGVSPPYIEPPTGTR